MGITTKKANPNKPIRALIYGEAGVGKTTFCSKSENPIFLCPEGGADFVKNSKGEAVDEISNISTWDDIRSSVRSLLNEKHSFETLVLDSADWIEKLCHAQIIGKSGKSITTCNGGYGAGYRQSEIMHKELIDDISLLREKRGMNIIVTAHATVRVVKDPSLLEDYESFEIKCHEMVSSLWREWVDALLFARFRTFVGEKGRAMGDGSRVIYAVKRPSFQAKNRYGMPPELNFTENFWVELKKYAQNGTSPLTLRNEINELLEKIKEDKMRSTIEGHVKDAGDDIQKLYSFIQRLKEITGGK